MENPDGQADQSILALSLSLSPSLHRDHSSLLRDAPRSHNSCKMPRRDNLESAWKNSSYRLPTPTVRARTKTLSKKMSDRFVEVRKSLKCVLKLFL